jgi:hypothetical protein
MKKLGAWLTVGIASAILVVSACEFGGIDEGVIRPGQDNGGVDATADTIVTPAGLCERAGGTTGASAIAADAVTRMKADCRLGSYFANLPATNTQRLEDCFDIYMKVALGCPGITYEGSKDRAGRACRNMQQSHQNLNITSDDYRAFSESVVAALRDTGKLISSDIGAVVARMNAERGVYNGGANGYPRCTCGAGGPCTPPPPPPPPDAGNDTGVRDATPDVAPDTGANDAADEGG